MSLRHIVGVGLGALMLMAYIGLSQVSTATNTVPSTRAGVEVLQVAADDLKPSQCAWLRPLYVIAGSGTITGTKADDLLVGSTADDELKGRQGDDCLVGGAGDDVLDGGGGNDVCIGGPGKDTFKHCAVEID